MGTREVDSCHPPRDNKFLNVSQVEDGPIGLLKTREAPLGTEIGSAPKSPFVGRNNGSGGEG